MADDAKPRPVSGEIMAQAGARQPGPSQADIIDAEFVSVPRRAGTRAEQPCETPVAFAPPPIQGMDLLKSRPATSLAATRAGPVFWVAGLALAACAFWVSGGHALVRAAPAATTHVPANESDPLRIADVVSKVVGGEGKSVLQVDGAAVNDGRTSRVLPPIEIRVTHGNGRVTRYILGTSDRPLAPDGRFDFSSRLEVPKDGVTAVSVVFSEDSAHADRQGQGH